MASSKHKGGRSGGSVGYKKPPIATQFRPGVSGNPAGRPKSAPTLHDLVVREAIRLVKMKTPDGILSMSRLEALVRRLFTKALDGDLAAARLVFQVLPPPQDQDVGPIHDDPLDQSDLDEEDLKRMLARFDGLRSGEPTK